MDIPIDELAKITVDETEVENIVKNIVNNSSNITDEKKLELLLKAVSFIDLTSLKGGETVDEIKDLCEKAVKPVETPLNLTTAAVCVYPASVLDVIDALKKLSARDKVAVASVAADFPAGKLPFQERLDEIKKVVKYDVDEIDIVIDRRLAVAGKWSELYEELKEMREMCGKKHMKTILATGELPSLKDVYIASMIAMMAGSDFIKTSTGKETVNATLPVGVVMSMAIKDYYKKSGRRIGLKPAGGIKTSKDALQWLTLIKEELGSEWLTKQYFRIGASSLLDNIVKSIDQLKN